MLKIGIIAGESSGDNLGAHLMAQLSAMTAVQFIGVGGEKMKAQGLDCVFDQKTLAVMGLSEIIRHLPRLVLAKQKVLSAFKKHQIDLFIGIDSPEFNLRIAKSLPSSVYRVHYVSPSLWAWRTSRIHGIGKTVDLMLCLFDFEPPIYHAHGICAEFVGHPLFALPSAPLPDGAPCLCLMPGSRDGEISAMLPTMLASTKRLSDEMAKNGQTLTLTLPYAKPHQAAIIAQMIADSELEVSITPHAQKALIRAHAVLVASGTATLEAMMLARPMVVIYKQSAITHAIISRLLHTPFIALPNILTKTELVPELIQDHANADGIHAALTATFAHLHHQHQALIRARASISHGMVCPARAILTHYHEKNHEKSHE